MAESKKQQSESQPRLLCVICGAPIVTGNYCGQCIDRGLGPCEACEGLSLLDVETTD